MPVSYQAQPIDFSFLAQAGTQLGSAVSQVPATLQAIKERERMEANLKKLQLRKDQAEQIRQTRVQEALSEYKTKMNITDDQMDERLKTKIEATFWPAAIIGDDVNASMKTFSDNDAKFEKWMNTNYDEKRKKEATTAAQKVIAGGENIYGPTKDTGQGTTEQTVMGETKPAKYREEAMAQYADLSARGEAPLMTAKELEQQPGIAALPARPKAPEDDPLFDLKKKNLELKNATELAREAALRAAAARDRNKEGREEGEKADAALNNVMTNRFDLERAVRDDSKLIKDLNTAIRKAADNTLDIETVNSLNAMGITSTDAKDLQEALIETQKAQEEKRINIGEMKKAEKMLIKTGTGPGATSRRAVEQDTYGNAMTELQTKVAPTISPMTGSVKQIIDRLSPENREAIQSKVDQLKQQAAANNVMLTDNDIVKLLTAKR